MMLTRESNASMIYVTLGYIEFDISDYIVEPMRTIQLNDRFVLFRPASINLFRCLGRSSGSRNAKWVWFDFLICLYWCRDITRGLWL